VRRLWAFVLCLLVWTAPAGLAQSDQDRAIKAMATFLKNMGETQAAQNLENGWANKQITIGPTNDNDNAQTSPGTPNIRFNTKILNEIFKGGKLDNRAVIDWAATYMHEVRHTTQSPTQWAGSYWQNVAGQGHPCEASAWGEGFQAYQNWLEKAQNQLANAPSEQKRIEAARLVLDLSQGYKEYYNNYPADYGKIQVDTRHGPMSLGEAAQEAQSSGDSVKGFVKTQSFSVYVSPRQHNLKAGASYTVNAVAKGGVPFYTYHWSVDGQPLPDEGKSLNRKAEASETVTVEVWDVEGRKVSDSCRVTVEESQLRLKLPSSLRVQPGEEFTLNSQVQGGRKPYTFRWSSNGKATQVTSSGMRGKRENDSDITVTVEDAAKKTATASCRVTVELQVTASPSELEIVPDQAFTLKATPRGGSPPYQYTWTEGSSTVGNSQTLTAKRKDESRFVVEVRDARGQSAEDGCRVTLGKSRDGVYSGRFRGIGKGSEQKSGTATSGMITLQVRGNTVTGRVGGSYGGDGFAGTLTGSIDANGSLNCTLNGKFTSEGGFSFTGWIRGRIANRSGSGNFGAANSWDTPTGSWEATWRSP